MLEQNVRPFGSSSWNPGALHEVERLRFLKISVWATLIAALIASVFTLWGRPLELATVFVLTSLTGSLLLIERSARRRLVFASWLFCSLLWGTITTVVIFYGGVRAPAALGYLIVVLLASFLLGTRVATVFAASSIAATGAVLWLELVEMLPPPRLEVTPLAVWATLAAALVWSATAMHSYTQSARRSDRALRESEEILRSVTESVPDHIMRLDPEGRIVFINRTAPGLTVAEVTGRRVYDFVDPAYHEEMERCFRQVLETGEQGRYDVDYEGPDDQRLSFESRVAPILHEGQVIGLTVTSADVTARKAAAAALARSESQLRHAQKMEAVGLLAGGLAHDFNNILTIISGHAHLIARADQLGEKERSRLRDIAAAAGRASSLTRQLLAFGRRQIMKPKVLDLGGLVHDMRSMLARIIGEDIRLNVRLCRNALRVKADPGQLEQVLMNLVVNARDAMPSGGTLGIVSRSVELEGNSGLPECLSPGDYALLEVSDTGEGIAPEVLPYVFEPFFTTKELGRGTGLGLSTVYGIIKQSHGHIEVSSEPGRSVFRIFLPLVHDELSEPAATEASGGEEKGTETILIVEDDAGVRALARETLLEHGYRVLVAADGAEALETVAGREDEIDLLVTDVVMPGMNGRKLAEAISATRPELRILYMSGYNQELTAENGELRQNAQLLTKPFTPARLTSKVREVLDANPTTVPARREPDPERERQSV